MDYAKLGRRVRQHRVLNQMTQERLAELAGVSTSFIGHIERGEKKASIETIVALCNALSVPPTVLLQDSLTEEVLRSQLNLDREKENLIQNMFQMFREYTEKENGQ